MVIGIGRLCGGCVDLLYFVKKWGRWIVVIITVLTCMMCRRFEPLAEFVVLRVNSVFQFVATYSEGAI